MESLSRTSVRVRPSTPRTIEVPAQDSPQRQYDPLYMLKKLTGLPQSSFSSLTHLQLVCDSSQISLHQFGFHCPQITSFKLNNSCIESLRDLGTDWKKLEILWIVRTGLTELEGISALPCLKELYAAFNKVSELSCLMFNQTLEILDLQGNQIRELSEIQYLEDCSNLWSLNLESNLVAKHPEYRKTVLEKISHLAVLDDTDRAETESTRPVTAEIEEFDLLLNSVRDTPTIKKKDLRPKTSSDGWSNLTQEAFQGNPLKAMRFKRKRKLQAMNGSIDDILDYVKEFKIEEKVPQPRQVQSVVGRTRKIMGRRLVSDFEQR